MLDDNGFGKLLVWQRAHEFELLIFRLFNEILKREMFGLIAQLRRSVISVTANIAKGYAFGVEGQFKRFLNVTQGSSAEVENYFSLTHDLNYVSTEEHLEVESLRKEGDTYFTD